MFYSPNNTFQIFISVSYFQHSYNVRRKLRSINRKVKVQLLLCLTKHCAIKTYGKAPGVVPRIFKNAKSVTQTDKTKVLT
jgi:hypothetical protein